MTRKIHSDDFKITLFLQNILRNPNGAGNIRSNASHPFIQLPGSGQSLLRRVAWWLYVSARPVARPLARRWRDFLLNDVRTDISRLASNSIADELLLIRRDQLAILRELNEIRLLLTKYNTHL